MEEMTSLKSWVNHHKIVVILIIKSPHMFDKTMNGRVNLDWLDSMSDIDRYKNEFFFHKKHLSGHFDSHFV